MVKTEKLAVLKWLSRGKGGEEVTNDEGEIHHADIRNNKGRVDIPNKLNRRGGPQTIDNRIQVKGNNI